MAELEEFDNEELAKDTLSSQFRKPNFETVAKVIGRVFNDSQGVNFEIKDGFWVDNAVNNQLTILGKKWDVARGTKTDDELRTEVKAATNASQSGTTTQLKGALLDKFAATVATIHGLWDAGEPAAYVAITDADVTVEQLEEISVGGVKAYLGSFLIQEDPAGKKIISESGKKIIGIGG